MNINFKAMQNKFIAGVMHGKNSFYDILSCIK